MGCCFLRGGGGGGFGGGLGEGLGDGLGDGSGDGWREGWREGRRPARRRRAPAAEPPDFGGAKTGCGPIDAGGCGLQKTESRGLQDLAFFEGTCPFLAKIYGFLMRVAETSTYVKVLQLCRFSPSLATIPKNAPVFSSILSVCSYFFCKFPLVFHGK